MSINNQDNSTSILYDDESILTNKLININKQYTLGSNSYDCSIIIDYIGYQHTSANFNYPSITLRHFMLAMPNRARSSIIRLLQSRTNHIEMNGLYVTGNIATTLFNTNSLVIQNISDLSINLSLIANIPLVKIW